ncbi:MAG: inorganic phosphate transporter [Planctomycetales bacterium]|nr:inorganic phosphate transporter [Planctomycetales bacterium]
MPRFKIASNRRDFATSVACGAGLTVLLATRFGLPVSTTHGLLGALVGAGLAAGSSIHMGKLFGDNCLSL